MSSYNRYSIIKKDDMWYACSRTRISVNEIRLDKLYQGKTVDKLWTNIKEKTNAIRHYRRRRQWVVQCGTQ